MKTFHVNTDLIEHIDAAEFAYSKGRMSVVRDVFGAPDLVRFVEAKPLLALIAPTIPNPYFNRILLSSPPAVDQLSTVLADFAKAGATPLIDVNPGAIDQPCAELLAARGFSQTEFHPLFVRPLSSWKTYPRKLNTRIVSAADDLRAFQDLYVQGWDVSDGFAATMKRYVEKWFSLPGWHLFLATDGETPVSTAVLFTKDRTAYLADATTPAQLRGRGGQMSLLSARVDHAKVLDCDMLFSRADFGSISHKNMEKIGVPMAFTRSVWKMLGR